MAYIVGINGGAPVGLPLLGIPAVVLMVPRLTVGQRVGAYALGVGAALAVACIGWAGYSS